MKKESTGHNIIEGIHYETGMPVRIEMKDGLIENIYEISGLKNKKAGLYVAPGLIDNQINGYAGVDFSGDALTPSDVISAAKEIWREGVTTFLPTVLTNSHENLIKNFSILRKAIEEDERMRASIPGFHLEGPYISPEEGYRGCHPLSHIRKPSQPEFDAYQQAASGRILQITLAPEIEGAMEFIRRSFKAGIRVGIGHTNASARQIAEAADNGARLSIHLGNGCANFIHRHNNPIWAQLANDLLTTTVIADGLHLSREEIRVFFKVKGPEKMIITSDIMYLAGMKPGKYTFLGSEVILTEEGMLLNPELNCLAGASFPLIKGVENIMNFTGCSLYEAINMASGNVAAIYGFNDRGNLLQGRRADIILFEKEGNRMIVRKTILNGTVVYDAEI